MDALRYSQMVGIDQAPRVLMNTEADTSELGNGAQNVDHAREDAHDRRTQTLAKNRHG